MADLVVTAAQVSPVNDNPLNHHTMIAAVAVTPGQVVYEDSAGKAALARANGIATVNGIVGVTLNTAAAGRPVDVLKKGALAGMGISALGYGQAVYVSSATAGAISDTAITGTGNVNLCIGRVRSMSDGDLTKVLDIDIPGNTVVTALP